MLKNTQILHETCDEKVSYFVWDFCILCKLNLKEDWVAKRELRV